MNIKIKAGIPHEVWIEDHRPPGSKGMDLPPHLLRFEIVWNDGYVGWTNTAQQAKFLASMFAQGLRSNLGKHNAVTLHLKVRRS